MRAILTLLFAALALPALAADKGGPVIALPAAVQQAVAPAASYTGCYGGIGGGWAISKTALSVGAFELDGLGADGGVLSALGGCDLQMGQLVLGAWGDYAWHQDHDFKFGPATTGLSESWAVGGRAGVIVGQALVFGAVGYTEAKLDIGDHKGMTYGGGVELPIGNGFALQGSYMYADLDAETYGGFLEVDPDIHSVRAALLYRFGVR